MQNALPRVNTIEHIGTIERAAARLGISDTEFIWWPWWLFVTPVRGTLCLWRFLPTESVAKAYLLLISASRLSYQTVALYM